MIIIILFVVCMFLWGLASIPHPTVAPFAPAAPLLAWIAVLLLGLHLFVPGLR
jgi:hypothetical protein